MFYFAYIRQKGSCYFRHEFLICQWHFSCSWESETRIQHSCDQQCDCYSPLHLYQLHQLYSGPHLQKAPGLTFVIVFFMYFCNKIHKSYDSGDEDDSNMQISLCFFLQILSKQQTDVKFWISAALTKLLSNVLKELDQLDRKKWRI